MSDAPTIIYLSLLFYLSEPVLAFSATKIVSDK